MTGQSDRLRRARAEAGFKSGAEAVRRHGFKSNTYKSNENGHAPYGFEQAKIYGKAYGVRPEWLYDGKLPVKDHGPRVVPLVGYVGAGAEAHFYSTGDEGLGEVEAPDGADETTRAAEIRGTSLGPLFENWLIFFDDVRSPVTPDLFGRLCIVGLPDGKVLVKKIQHTATEGFFHLLSNAEEPLFDQEVLWAARVKTMTPR